MRFKQIELTNFMSIHHAKIDLDNQKLILVKGDNQDSSEYRSNGAGKSTLFDGITYALFEKTTRDLSANDYINESFKKDMCINLDFIADDDHNYRIARHRKDGSFKNDTLLFQDKKNITPKSNRDTNQLIQKIIGIDFLTFTNSILFGQGILKTFPMATDAEKKRILDQILKLDVWSDALEEAKSELKEAKDKLVQLDYKIENKDNLIASKQNSILSMKEKATQEKESIKQQIKQLNKQIADERSSIDKKVKLLTDKMKAAKVKLQKLSDTDLKNKLHDYNEQLIKLKKKLESFSEYQDKVAELEDQKNKVLVDCRVIERQIKKLRKQYHDILSGVGNTCPVCGQPITEEGIQGSVDHIIAEGKKLDARLPIFKKKVKEIERQQLFISKNIDQKDSFVDQYNDVQDRISHLQAKLDTVQDQQSMLKNQIDDFNIHISDLSDGNSLQPLLDSLRSKKDELNNSRYDEIVNETKNNIIELKKQKAQLALSRTDTKIDCDNLTFAVSAFGNSGIKSYILDTVTPYLNKQANHYLTKLTGGTTEVEFTTQTKLKNGEYRDKFDVKIDNHIGGSSYKKNSTGERKRVDLAISLALQNLVMSRAESQFNLLLYDECFDGLDDIGCENVIQLLQELQKKVPSIFVITHNDTLKSFFEHTLLVTKKNGESKIRKVE